MEGSRFNPDIPPEEILDIPEDVNEASLDVAIETVARIAEQFGLDAMTAIPIEPERPESLDDFIKQVEERVTASSEEVAEKEGALKALESVLDELLKIKKAVQSS